MIKWKTTIKKVNGQRTAVTEELYRYDHVYQSTASHGGTIFWKQNAEYLKHTRSKEYL
jgi:hypothetical protein